MKLNFLLVEFPKLKYARCNQLTKIDTNVNWLHALDLNLKSRRIELFRLNCEGKEAKMRVFLTCDPLNGPSYGTALNKHRTQKAVRLCGFSRE